MINQIMNEFLISNSVFKTSELVDFLTNNVPTEKSKASNFVNVSLNRMKNEKDNEGRVVTKIDKGVYAVGKLTIDQIWEINKQLNASKYDDYKKLIEDGIRNKTIFTAGMSYAYENKYCISKPNHLFFISKNFSKKYKDVEISDVAIYSYVENNKEIYNSFPDNDDMLIRRLISSIDYISVDDNNSVEKFIVHLENNNINFIKFILFTIKEFNTKLNGRKFFEQLMDSYSQIKK